MKSFCIGAALGMTAGFALAAIPAVQTIVNDLKNVVDNDVIVPIKNAVEKAKSKQETTDMTD